MNGMVVAHFRFFEGEVMTTFSATDEVQTPSLPLQKNVPASATAKRIFSLLLGKAQRKKETFFEKGHGAFLKCRPKKMLNAYRYGFNGKEKDNSFASTNNYDYGFRIYNPKIAKFLSVDPLTKKYPELTPYQFASNRPIDGIDLDGLEWTVHEIDDGTNTYIGITLDVAILNSTGGSRYDEFALQSAVAKQLQNSYTFSETQTGSSGKSGVFDVIITVNVRTIIDKKYLSNTELLIDVRNQNDPEVKNLYGKASSIGGSTVYLNEKYIPGIISGSDNNTVPHEVGHTGGLLHIDALSTRLQDLLPWTENQYYNDSEQKNNPDNAMYEGGSGKINDKTSIKINKEQIKIIATEYKEGDINKKD